MNKQKTEKTKAAKKTAAAPAKAKKPSKPRMSAADVDKHVSALVAIVKQRPGLSASEASATLGIATSQFGTIARRALETGEVFRGGNRRFARYASTQAAADSASLAARAPKVAA